MKYKEIILYISSVIGGLFGFLFGKVDTIFYILVCLCVIDFLSGILNGIIDKTLNSKKCYYGIRKKIFMFVIIALSHLIDLAVKQNIIMNVAIFFYITNESLSIIENVAKSGLPVPKKLIEVLEQLKDKKEQED